MKILLTVTSLTALCSSFVLISWPEFDSELQQFKDLLGLENDQETNSKPRPQSRPRPSGKKEKKEDLQVESSTASSQRSGRIMREGSSYCSQTISNLISDLCSAEF